jgi:hypothetical protein
MNQIGITDVKSAIESFIEDCNKYPICYDLNDVKKLNNPSFWEEIIDAWSENYEPHTCNSVYIPYDIVSSRLLVLQPIRDVIIKYIIMNKMKSELRHSLKDQSLKSFIFENNINVGTYFKADIFDCYENINHNFLIESIESLLKKKLDYCYFKVLRNSLSIPILMPNNETIIKNVGVLIGSKPDEYWANIFLSSVELKLSQAGLNVCRESDEFIVFSKNVKEAREHYQIMEKEIAKIGLAINKSKNIIKHFTHHSSKEIILELIIENSSDPIITHQLRKDYSKGRNNETTQLREISRLEHKNEIIHFLESMNESVNSIINFQNKINTKSDKPDIIEYPSSVNKTAFEISNLERLVEIIKYHPRGEYYTSLAIKILVFVAKNANYTIDRFEIDISKKMFDASENVANRTFVYSNVQIINLLGDIETHDYQKYLIIRHLYKDETGLAFQFKNYSVSPKFVDFFDSVQVTKKLPFEDTIRDLLNDIYNSTSYYPLRDVCKTLLMK